MGVAVAAAAAAAAYLFALLYLLSHHILLLHSASAPPPEEEKYCPPFYCGKDYEDQTLGWLTVDNCSEQVEKIQVKVKEDPYDVVNIARANTIDLNDQLLIENLKIFCECKEESSPNLTISSPSISFETKSNLKCIRTSPHTYFSYISNRACSWYYTQSSPEHPPTPPSSSPPECLPIQPPINITDITNHQFSLLAAQIFLKVRVSHDCHKCYYNGSECHNDINGKFQCSKTDTDKGKNKMGLKPTLGIIVASAVGIGVLMFIVWRKFSSNKFMGFWKKETQSYQNVEMFLKNHGSLTPKRYSYSDVKKMTNSFKDKLGQGGYGGVYKGKLPDGRLVAVKVLNKSKGDGQEFINEVASISRTSHVNIVTLLGFCFEGSKSALIYEFMPNGSLDKFIYNENLLKENRQLGWETLYQIVIGIARGLEYLHRGCNTRILHFDIKPHNILLDEDFCPKISDFGLAKLCPKNESIISLLGARGTAGYIAPEVFCRNFGGVSHKSDVYSYGMMILEMIGGRKNIDVGVEHSSEIYFLHGIYKHLEQSDQLGLHGIMNEEENEKARKMILVGLWCIQSDPSNRPPMGRVVDMLQGSLGSLQIPPKPFLSSLPGTQADSLTSSVGVL